jgi:hypothetical protein
MNPWTELESNIANLVLGADSIKEIELDGATLGSHGPLAQERWLRNDRARVEGCSGPGFDERHEALARISLAQGQLGVRYASEYCQSFKAR